MDGIVTSDGAVAQNRIYVQILEQPAPKALRFRYECEGRSAGSLPGAKSTTDKKTFPKIQIVGHTGRAVVVVSCVTLDPPYRPHPHNLVGKEGCKKGVCTMEIANEDMTSEFSNLGIQCVKKKDIEDSLKVREEIRVDPYRTGFGHKTQPGSIDLNSVRLCFQVFLEGPERGQFKIPLKAIVSDPIFDKKAINDLTIMKLSDCSSPVIGNKEIILLCDKVSKDDIEVRFFEEQDGAVVWEAFGDFQPSDVHKQFAICFRVPQYRDLEITNPARVYIQLRCPSKDTTSLPRPFDYIPLSSGKNKRGWCLASFYKSVAQTSADMSLSSDSAIAIAESLPPPAKKMDLEDILGEEDAYKCLNEFILQGVGVNEGKDSKGALGAEAMEEGELPTIDPHAILKKVGEHDPYEAENAGNGPDDYEGYELGIQNGHGQFERNSSQNWDGMVETNGNAAPQGAVMASPIIVTNVMTKSDPTYSSFELAMKNPIEFGMSAVPPEDIIPPRPPKNINSAHVIISLPDPSVPAPPLPPRRKGKDGKHKSSKEEKKSSGIFKLFGGSPKKEKKPKGHGQPSKENPNLNTLAAPVVLLPSVLNSNVNTNPSLLIGQNINEDQMLGKIVPAMPFDLLESPIDDFPELTAQTLETLTEAENYALYVDSTAPRATASEFDEMSAYYGDVVNNN